MNLMKTSLLPQLSVKHVLSVRRQTRMTLVIVATGVCLPLIRLDLTISLASQLFEYQWPLGDPTAEYYMLQEQVKEFLDIRGIQRKYPDWSRRTLEVDERKYLVGMGVVTETLSNMGLVALHSEEVLETMATDYPKRYSEFVEVLKEKEFQRTLKNKMMEAKRVAAVNTHLEADESIFAEVRFEAMKMVGQFNKQLTEQRETLIKGHINPHTKLEQIPRPPQVIQPAPIKSLYPAALLPGQYSDYCPTFTPEELSQLPLNTVSGVPKYLCLAQDKPPPQLSSGGQGKLSNIPPAVKTAADNLLKALNSSAEKHSQTVGGKQVSLLNSIQKLLTSYSGGVESGRAKSGESSKPSSNVSTQRSSLTELLKVEGQSGKGSSITQVSEAAKEKSEDKVKRTEIIEDSKVVKEDSKEVGEGDKEGDKDVLNCPMRELSDRASRLKRANVRTALCSVCRKGRGANMKGVAEDLIRCSQCFTFVHPTCYNLPVTIFPILKLYNWQCLECKSCQICQGPHEEDKMVFCDDCDRGYHSFCVGLDKVPSGSWLCPVCGQCASCETEKAGPTAESKWKHEYLNGRFIHTHCVECSEFFRRGNYCPICYKVYRNDHTDSSMVCCDSCDRWVHTGCDGISDEEYHKLSEDKSNYICKLCRNK